MSILSVGRIVWFYNSPSDDRSKPLAAIVTSVISDVLVNVVVFNLDGNITPKTSVEVELNEGAPHQASYVRATTDSAIHQTFRQEGPYQHYGPFYREPSSWQGQNYAPAYPGAPVYGPGGTPPYGPGYTDTSSLQAEVFSLRNENAALRAENSRLRMGSTAPAVPTQTQAQYDAHNRARAEADAAQRAAMAAQGGYPR